MNAKELELQKHPLFFTIYLEVQKKVSSQDIFEKFQGEYPDHDDLKRVIADVQKLQWDRLLWPAIGWTIPAVPLVLIAFFMMFRGVFTPYILAPAVIFFVGSLRHWVKLAGQNPGTTVKTVEGPIEY